MRYYSQKFSQCRWAKTDDHTEDGSEELLPVNAASFNRIAEKLLRNLSAPALASVYAGLFRLNSI